MPGERLTDAEYVTRHVIPAKAGIHHHLKLLDPRLHGDDTGGRIYVAVKISLNSNAFYNAGIA